MESEKACHTHAANETQPLGAQVPIYATNLSPASPRPLQSQPCSALIIRACACSPAPSPQGLPSCPEGPIPAKASAPNPRTTLLPPSLPTGSLPTVIPHSSNVLNLEPNTETPFPAPCSTLATAPPSPPDLGKSCISHIFPFIHFPFTLWPSQPAFHSDHIAHQNSPTSPMTSVSWHPKDTSCSQVTRPPTVS